jgi:multidrug efflux pump subunit AcrB
MPADDDASTVFGRIAFTVFLIVILLIAGVLIAQRIPHAQRPTMRHPVTTQVTTSTPPSKRS